MGTASIGLGVLDLLCAHPLIDLKLIVAPTSKKVGREMVLTDPATIQFAKERKIEFYQTDSINNDENLFKKIQDYKVDVLLVFAFSQFLSKRYLEVAKYHAYNIHTSLLPKYRGASPIQFAILNGDTQTGICIQKMAKKMDAGDIVLKKECPIYEYETTPLLYERLKLLAGTLMGEFIDELLVKNKNSSTFMVQEESGVSFAPEIKKEDGVVDFEKDSAFKIEKMLRAYYPWPGVFFTLEGEKIQLIQAKIYTTQSEIPTTEKKSHKGLYARCADSTFLKLEKIKRAGKKVQTDNEFLNGYRGEFSHGTYFIA